MPKNDTGVRPLVPMYPLSLPMAMRLASLTTCAQCQSTSLSAVVNTSPSTVIVVLPSLGVSIALFSVILRLWNRVDAPAEVPSDTYSPTL